MAKKIQAWVKYGPRLVRAGGVTPEGMIERIMVATNQSRGSVKAILDEWDAQAEIALKEGQIVRMPNGTHLMPVGHRDGSIGVAVRVNPRLVRNLNTHFRGRWHNCENIGRSEAEIIALWNESHPDDPIEEP